MQLALIMQEFYRSQEDIKKVSVQVLIVHNSKLKYKSMFLLNMCKYRVKGKKGNFL